MIKLKNPRSVTFLEVDADNKFKYAFLAFGESIRGFQLMRKVILVDGSFLKSKFRGTLFGASVQDDAGDLVFVSNRVPVIANALSTNYPLAHHEICTFHFQKNLETQFRNGWPKIADYLVKADIQKWSRAYSLVNCLNITTSNSTDLLNAMLKESLHMPCIRLEEIPLSSSN